MTWREELQLASELLKEQSMLPPPPPTWEPCTCCGIKFKAEEGCPRGLDGRSGSCVTCERAR